jgi:carboxymethylenebutenolidase
MDQISYNGKTFYTTTNSSEIGLIVIQEWWGVTPHILRLCQTLSSLPARVITPDLYNGAIATKPDEAMHLYSNLDWPGALAQVCFMRESL